mmetsp:Transcript_76/g.85  ORF Transcript_76/g.85 Transcript_76/m.85 type:complete len:235 (-) Transcript_76:93-797(-)|eukprot:CAMPEP_0114334844 /NCGR_PEP_ID=MMETSP0101-20121206/4653_1 /TAXON_ID=38822 ORGANISM="Pteridomonas danica, Strain PT" /NCGR_SAMPLE_ID=MMETSP0101 /ASSEMBLY_ACC=CAM_ASM_000211 /LENGTH=234 /DNA_ID=CAMNT_0001466253 /DNA_START=13 /DNA_END=717 /DNA_ORIENTATION=-
MAFSKQMDMDDIYAELGISKGSKNAKGLLSSEDPRKVQLAEERSQRRLEKERQNQLTKSSSSHFDPLEARELKKLNFKVDKPGRIVCGTSKQTTTKPIVEKEKNLFNVDDSSTLLSSSHSVETVEEEHEASDTIDGEPGKWRRLTSEQYVDFYLNGGKYEPPADSLMEEVDRQRQREGGYRSVGLYEAGFIGKMRSPLGKLGTRFRNHLEPLSVKQITMYKKTGQRRPLDMGDA